MLIILLLLLLTNCFPPRLSRTSTFFYLRPRKPEVRSLPGHGADATDVVAVKEQVSSFPVRVACSVQRFACCKLQAEEKTPCCSSRPPSCLVVVGPSPFPGDCGKGVGGARGRGAAASAEGAHGAPGLLWCQRSAVPSAEGSCGGV